MKVRIAHKRVLHAARLECRPVADSVEEVGG